ncbi:(d)CMP kinase [Lapillicoccus sp.]|uniref:(d)CMP kinase n=1 Tax=Lapillicoccus sp. TaxID=1909287 RepID=UPI0025D26180|nr:(d)CMP kinase [Lapillicoccus sp.]
MPSTPRADLVVAIDGPSGSGKSSVSRAVARALGVGFLDTGAMYRAVAWWCLERSIDLGDRAAVAEAARTMPLALTTDPDAPSVVVGATDVSAAIRGSRISERVSQVATNLGVREILVGRQRELIAETVARTGGCVAEGRDITTVVAPDAAVRVLLTASVEVRLARRATELHGEADRAAVEATRDQVERRDRDDGTVSDFLTAADGVVTVDTSDLDFDGSVAAVLHVVDVVAGVAR